jgi:Arc/MetJ-type ribon-helix-helix transcriptional regulator
MLASKGVNAKMPSLDSLHCYRSLWVGLLPVSTEASESIQHNPLYVRRWHRLPRALEVDTKHWGMEVDLTPDQTALIRQAIDAGRLGRPEEAVQEALSLWEERERRRAEILAAVEIAKTSLAAGKGRVITEDSMRQLADEVKQRGRARLAVEQQTHR